MTLSNDTNMTFENATLKLVAGDINTVNNYMMNRKETYEARITLQDSAAGFTEKEFFDYHTI